MKPKVWTEVALHPEALTRLQAVAEVVGGSYDTLPGAEAAVIGSSQVSTAFIEQAGPGLKLVVRIRALKDAQSAARKEGKA